MAWTPGSTLKTQMTSGKPIIGTGLTGDQIADDLDYLKNAVDGVGVQSNSNIYDDFVVAGTGAGNLNTDDWENVGDVGTLSFTAFPDHAAQFSTTTAEGAGIGASAKRMRFDLDRDFTLRMEAIWGKATNNGDQSIVIGFQDDGLTGDALCGNDITDTIAFVKGTNNNTLKAWVSKGGVSLAVADNLSDWTSYLDLRIDITFAGATKKVEFFIGGSSVGSTTDTAKIPTVRMRPLIGQYGNNAVARVAYTDYAAFFWTVRPRST